MLGVAQGRKDPVLARIPNKRSHHPDRRNLAATTTVEKAGADVSGFVSRLTQAIAEQGTGLPGSVSASRVGRIFSTNHESKLLAKIQGLEAECDRSRAENEHLREKLRAVSDHLAQAIDAINLTPLQHVVKALPTPIVVDTSREQILTLSGPAVRALKYGKLSKAVSSILAVLKAHYPKPRTRESIALQAGYSVSGGGFLNALSQARVAGLLEGSHSLTITAKGIQVVGDVRPIPTGKALANYWAPQLGRAERCILEVVTIPPRRAFSREYIAQQAGYAAKGGGFLNALSRLRTLGIVEGSREIKAAPEFFALGST